MKQTPNRATMYNPKDPYEKESKLKHLFTNQRDEVVAVVAIRPYATPGVRFKDGRPYLPEGRYTDASDFINTISKQR